MFKCYETFQNHTNGVCHSMSIQDQTVPQVEGNEALTFGETLVSFFKEVSLGVDAFNAKNFNKSVHTVQGIEVWKDFAAKNDYFSVASKHIPSPVFFNASKISFKDYVALVLRAVPMLKLVSTQADVVYRNIKQAAVSGKVSHSIRNIDNNIMFDETKEQFNAVISDTGIYTRAVQDMYPSFGEAYNIGSNFNSVVKTLQARDVELVAKQVDQVLYIVKLLKDKVDNNEIIFDKVGGNLLNDAISDLVGNVTFVGKMVNLLSDLTRVLQLQVEESKKL